MTKPVLRVEPMTASPKSVVEPTTSPVLLSCAKTRLKINVCLVMPGARSQLGDLKFQLQSDGFGLHRPGYLSAADQSPFRYQLLERQKGVS